MRLGRQKESTANGGEPAAARKPSGGMKTHLVAAIGEFVGTVIFLWFAFAAHQMVILQASDVAVRNLLAANQAIIFIALAYGFSLLVTVWIFYRVTSGVFNPAVTIGLMAAGVMPIVRGIILIVVQFLGAIVAAALVAAMFPGDIEIVNTVLSPDTSIARGLFIEMFLTTFLTLTVLMVAGGRHRSHRLRAPAATGDVVITTTTYDTTSHGDDGKTHYITAPIAIGLALFVANLAGLYYTGASLNPARSFGPAVAGADFPGHHWIYWLGPILGGILAAVIFRIMKVLRYDEARGGLDDLGAHKEHGPSGADNRV